MDRPSSPDDEDVRITLRVPMRSTAIALALLLHVLAYVGAELLPEPKKPPQRVELSLRPSTPPPSASAPPAPSAPPETPRPPTKRRAAPPPSTAPVAPELPPSDAPPENRAQLPVVEPSPAPAPPPQPSTWAERVKEQLAATTPKAHRAPTGVLAPSAGTVERVAAADPRLHDEATEQRLQQDFGPFFRRGIELLRGHWHPDEVLALTERDPARRCGGRMRTTYAVAVLDREGDVVDVDLRRGSGCPELDVEAVAAFKRAARFPFPPEGMFVGPDGAPTTTARFPVRFIVTFDGGLRIEWN